MDLSKGGLVGMAFERIENKGNQQEQGPRGQLNLHQQGYQHVTMMAQEWCASPPHGAHRDATLQRT